MITQVDPPDFQRSSTVQVDSDAGNLWLAIEDIEDWASQHGFVRTGEYHLRQVLIDGRHRFRGVCYRISEEERAAIEATQREMADRGDGLRGVLPRVVRSP
jgi:hypothetical protein